MGFRWMGYYRSACRLRPSRTSKYCDTILYTAKKEYVRLTQMRQIATFIRFCEEARSTGVDYRNDLSKLPPLGYQIVQMGSEAIEAIRKMKKAANPAGIALDNWCPAHSFTDSAINGPKNGINRILFPFPEINLWMSSWSPWLHISSPICKQGHQARAHSIHLEP